MKFSLNLLVFLFLSLININSQSSSSSAPVSSYYDGIIIKIEQANPKIFFQNDEIYINIKILNTSKEEKSLIIANDKKFSFDFQMVTMQNKQIEHSKDYIVSFHKIQPVFNANIRLAPDEGYVYEARLNDYFDLSAPGQYYITSLYYPRLKLNNDASQSIASTQLSLNIRPGATNENRILEQAALEEEKKLHAEKKAPDEAVSFMLNARMKGEWDKFYLYLDLDKLILTNNSFRARYLKSDSENQKALIQQYKEYLKKNTIDEISFLPHRFQIIKTEYSENKAKVDAVVYFKYLDFEEKKYYTYFLSKKQNIWQIASYEVLNLGTK